MEADEAPRSARGFITRMAGAFLGLLLLYVLSIGPVMYFRAQSHLQRFGARTLPSFPKIYAPLYASVRGTPVEMWLLEYRSWCVSKAMLRAMERYDAQARKQLPAR
jgi:hypothetical protein